MRRHLAIGNFYSRCFLVGAAVLGAILVPWTIRYLGPAKSSDVLWVPPEQLHFGEVGLQEEFTWDFSLENRSDREIVITDFQPTCHCTSVEPRSLRIPALGSAAVRVKLDLMPASESELLNPSRPFAVTIQPRFEGGWPRQEGWQITGTIRNPYQASPAFVNFGESLVEGLPFASQFVSVRGEEELGELTAISNSPRLATKVRRSNEDEKLFYVELTPDPALPVGEHEFSVELRGQTSQGIPLPQGHLRVLARVVPDVQVAPRVLALGEIPLGGSVNREVLLSSRSGRPIAVENLAVDGGSAELLSNPTPRGGDSTRLQFVAKADRLGIQSGTMIATVRVGDGTARDVRIRYFFTGVDHHPSLALR